MDRRALSLLGGVSLACLSLAASGCGDSRTPAPNLTAPASPAGFKPVSYPAAGVSLAVPTNWAVLKRSAPLVAVLTSGEAVVAVWRFARSAPPPVGSLAMRAAADRLIAAARARDSALHPIRARAVAVDGARAIELDALERIDGQLRRVRSVHAFVPGAEVVLDEYAPPSVFHAVDHAVFSPVKRSLRLLPPGA